MILKRSEFWAFTEQKLTKNKVKKGARYFIDKQMGGTKQTAI
jgi:hypothetical protein